MSLEPDPPLAGVPFTLVLGGRNPGAASASGVILTATVPAGVQVTALPDGCARTGEGVSCDVGSLAAGERAERRLTMRAADITAAEFRGDARSSTSDTRTSGTGARLRRVVLVRSAQGSPILPPPRPGETVNVYVASGRVLVRLPGGRRFVRIRQARQVPVGSTVDARRGRVQLVTAADAAGSLETGLFHSGAFRFTQSRSTGLSTLALALGDRRSCPRVAARAGAAQRRQGERERSRGRRIRFLWSRAKGRFRTRSNAASATVRGTTWLTADYCAGSLIDLRTGGLTVRDVVRGRTIVLRGGQSYFAPLSRSRPGERTGRR